MDHQAMLTDTQGKRLVLDRGFKDHGNRSQSLVGGPGQASVDRVAQADQFLPRVLDRPVDRLQGIRDRLVHAFPLGRDDGRADRLAVDLVKVRALVQVEDPVGLKTFHEGPDRTGQIPPGLILFTSLGKIPVQVAQLAGRIGHVTDTCIEPGCVGPGQDHQLAPIDGPVHDLSRRSGTRRLIPVHPTQDQDHGTGLAALQHAPRSLAGSTLEEQAALFGRPGR